MSVPSCSAAPARARTAAGSSVGRSPCRLTTRSNRRSGSMPRRAAKMRSVPDGRSGSVSTASPPAGPHRLGDLRLGAGDHHRPHARLVRPAPDVHDHRLARDRGQRLPGQAGRAEPVPGSERSYATICHRLASRIATPYSSPRAVRRRQGAAPCRERGGWSTHPVCASARAAPGAAFWQPTRICIPMAGSLEGNKLVAAFLTAGIVGVGSAVFAGILYHPHHLEEPVYLVEAAAPAGGGAAAPAAEEAKPIGELLASANADNGAKIAKKCAACHDLTTGGANKVGPDLWGVVNRPIASHEGFSYSDALSGKKDQAWDYDHLNHFLTSPKAYAPGTKMSFAGISKDAERADVIAYLRTPVRQPGPAARRLRPRLRRWPAPRYREFEALAHRLADCAGEIQRRYFRTPVSVETKADASPVTIADREAEARDARADRGRLPRARHPGRGVRHRAGRRRVRLGARSDRRHQIVHHRPPAVRHADRPGASRPARARHDRPVDPARALGRRRRRRRRSGTAGRSGYAPAPGSRTRSCSRPARAMFRAGAENEGFARVQASVRLPMFGGDCYAYGLLAMGFADLVVEASLQPYDFMALVPVIEGAGGSDHRLAGPAASARLGGPGRRRRRRARPMRRRQLLDLPAGRWRATQAVERGLGSAARLQYRRRRGMRNIVGSAWRWRRSCSVLAAPLRLWRSPPMASPCTATRPIRRTSPISTTSTRTRPRAAVW